MKTNSKKSKSNLQSILKYREKLFAALTQYCGATLTGPDLEGMAEDTARILPGSISVSALYHTFRGLAGQQLKVESLYEVCWRIAGNLPILASGQTISSWLYQSKPEFMYIQSTEVTPELIKNKPMAKFKFKIMSGSACTMLAIKLWSLRFLPVIARKLGFRRKTMLYQDPTELVGFRFMAEFSPDLTRNNQPSFNRFCIPADCKEHNKRILLARAKLKPNCPQNYSHPCFRCPIGYDNCIAGTHPTTMNVVACSMCKQLFWKTPAQISLCPECSK